MTSISKDAPMSDSDFVYVSSKPLLRTRDAETKTDSEYKKKAVSQGTVPSKEAILPQAAAAAVCLVLGKGSALGPKLSLPPVLDTTARMSQTLRFVCTSTAVSTVNVNDLVLAGGGIAYSSTVVYSMASCFKLRKVTVWPNAGGYVQLAWGSLVGNIQEDSLKDESTPTGITNTTPVQLKPPPGTLLHEWVNLASGSAVAFTISSGSGSIVDVEIEYKLSNRMANVSATGIATTAGVVYYGALDGSSRVYTPVGRVMF
jgi:hypothetical protein